MRRITVAAVLLLGLNTLWAAEQAPGLVGEYFYLRWLVSDFPHVKPDLKPTLKRVDAQIAFPWVQGEFYGTKLNDRFFVRWSGTIRTPAKGHYTFFTESDDGSRLFIDGKLIVSNQGLHAMQEEEGDVDLDAGEHRCKVEYIQYDGGAGINALWKTPGGIKEVIPASVFQHSVSEEAADVATAVSKDPAPENETTVDEPPEKATVEEKVAAILPKAHEKMWMDIPWRRNLHAARRESQLTGKPLFLWIMNGNPLGCT